MSRKSGDDYAARVYVAFEFPRSAMNLSTRFKLSLARQIFGEHVPDAAINYVWDNRYPIGTDMPNAYTDRMRMTVVQSGPTNAGHWVQEQRNVLQDARQAFGDHPMKASLLAVASDTDNTSEQARAGFADLHFVGADVSCNFPTASH